MRSYAHFALPAPFLGGTEIEWLDAIVARERGWAPAGDDGDGICVSRTWAGPHGGELRMVVLGFYPALATVGGPGRERRAMDRVLARLLERVQAAGGMEVADQDLAHWVAMAADRWVQVRDAEREIEGTQVWLEFVQCARCEGLTSQDSPSCRACGHRFTGAERAEQDRRREQARKIVEDARTRHTALSGGWGMLPAGGGQRLPGGPA